MKKIRQALVIFAKAPEHGKVKTRLVPPLSSSQATELYRCFLRDTIENVSRLDSVDVVISYTPKGKEYLFEEIAPGYELILQEGDSFGPRLFSCFQKLFSAGYDSVCVMDTDSPTLNMEFLVEGFSFLAKHDDSAVIGPSEDGGYYVIGLRKLHKEMFEGITWSTEKVTAESLRQAESINLTVHLLPTWFDVDTGAELMRLMPDVCNGSATGYDAAHTRVFLESLVVALAESA